MTPRTGDRVLVSARPTYEGRGDGATIPTSTGHFRWRALGTARYEVVLDSGVHAVVSPDRLTVLDRDPIHWPTYVSNGVTSARWTSHAGISPYHSSVAYSAADARRNADAWTYVADHYDELRRL